MIFIECFNKNLKNSQNYLLLFYQVSEHHFGKLVIFSENSDHFGNFLKIVYFYLKMQIFTEKFIIYAEKLSIFFKFSNEIIYHPENFFVRQASPPERGKISEGKLDSPPPRKFSF